MRHEISDKVWTWEPAATLQCGCAQTGCSVAHQPMKIMFGDRHEEMTSWTPQALFLSIVQRLVRPQQQGSDSSLKGRPL